ncbi:MAG: LysE family transporter [Coriobacteriales bacterium]|jgi:L-lysine exporter family protein LysE/ArgO|nr:LysE family transporter [Coriobacteriales bacterium]
MLIFLQGLTMGLAYVAPIGTQNMFVINAALTKTRRMAYLTALIVVFFDVTLALACFLGVGAVLELWPVTKTIVLLVGSVLVVLIGIRLLRDKGEVRTVAEADKADKADTVTEADRTTNMPLGKVIVNACVVTWLNPQALIDGTMLLGAFRATLPVDEGWHFVAGVMCASLVWFMGITVILHVFRHRFTPRIIRWINILCGVVIVGYGIKLFVDFVMSMVHLMSIV